MKRRPSGEGRKLLSGKGDTTKGGNEKKGENKTTARKKNRKFPRVRRDRGVPAKTGAEEGIGLKCTFGENSGGGSPRQHLGTQEEES